MSLPEGGRFTFLALLVRYDAELAEARARALISHMSGMSGAIGAFVPGWGGSTPAPPRRALGRSRGATPPP